MPKSKTPRATSKKLVARTTASGAQQYVRGKTDTDRVITAGDAGSATKKHKAQQMLLKAQKDAMSPGARAYSAQRAEDRKRYDLRFGRQRAAARAKVK
jgi:hypothetical protein